MTQPRIPVDEIFFETLRCVSVAESAAYLDRVCASDLRSAVASSNWYKPTRKPKNS